MIIWLIVDDYGKEGNSLSGVYISVHSGDSHVSQFGIQR